MPGFQLKIHNFLHSSLAWRNSHQLFLLWQEFLYLQAMWQGKGDLWSARAARVCLSHDFGLFLVFICRWSTSCRCHLCHPDRVVLWAGAAAWSLHPQHPAAWPLPPSCSLGRCPAMSRGDQALAGLHQLLLVAVVPVQTLLVGRPQYGNCQREGERRWREIMVKK